jgi:hypothetical protein
VRAEAFAGLGVSLRCSEGAIKKTMTRETARNIAGRSRLLQIL